MCIFLINWFSYFWRILRVYVLVMYEDFWMGFIIIIQ